MTPVTVRAGNQSYEALVGSNLLKDIGSTLAKTLHRPLCAIISDTKAAALFADRVKQSLTSAGFQLALVTIPAGERSKTLEEVSAICDEMIAAGLDRQAFVVGLGGGMVGDLSGFVAAVFERGIPHVQIPTTLLAMVDSSIGGKTGVNTTKGKNLIGVFHHPSLVIDDVDLLETLPRREFNQGFAEIIKHAIIADAAMFSRLENEWASNALALQSLIRRNIEIKAGFVAIDEFDRTGERALLNFGHTIGHAIERAGDYHMFLHGEAISLGMVAASAISVKKAGLATDQRDSIAGLLEKFELPTRLPVGFPREKIFDTVKFDKKFERGNIRFVVTPKIGAARLSSDVTMEDIREAVEML